MAKESSLPSPQDLSPLTSPPQKQAMHLQKSEKSVSVNQMLTSPLDNEVYQPVTLRVNEDDEQDEQKNFPTRNIEEICARFQSSRPSSQASEEDFEHTSSNRFSTLAADIPQGLVKKNREIAQHEQTVDHAKNDAQLIKEQRRIEDAALLEVEISLLHRSQQSQPASQSAHQDHQVLEQKRLCRSDRCCAKTNIHAPASPQQNAKHVHSAKSHSSTPSTDTSSPSKELSEEYSHKKSDNRINASNNNYFASSNGSAVKHSNASLMDYAAYSEDSSSYSTEIPPPEPPVDYDDQTPRGKLPPKFPGSAPDKTNRRESSSGDNNRTVKENQRAHSNVHKNTPTSTAPTNVDGSKNGWKKHPINQWNSLSVLQKVATSSNCNQEDKDVCGRRYRSHFNDTPCVGVKQDFELRKKEMQDLKRMQREEARQQQELSSRAEQLRVQQERKFEFEKQAVQKAFEGDIETISRAQKKKMEEMEKMQEEELRNVLKRIRIDQEHRLRNFKEGLRQEQKLMKQEVEMLPKKERKDVYRQRKELLDKFHFDQEAKFITQLEREQEVFLNRAREDNREKMAMMERNFMEQRHQLERSMESALWELEERQLADKHKLLTQHIPGCFHLQRTHMLARHHKEQEHIRKINQANEENLLRALTTDRKGLPKALRNESKTRTIMFKESLRIDLPEESMERWSEKIHDFEEKEKQRIRMKMDEYDLKCKRRLAQMVLYNKNVCKELEEIHNEKRNMLVDNERAKLNEYEKEYQQLLHEWKNSLPSRKAALESRFSDELETQQRFYGVEGTSQQAAGPQ
uniref:STE20-like serine/threonine-protein kinase n=1 Tax=Ditylenchus dipsaci TaxID=166011 RepID=A0A915D023_9BILA